MGETLEELQSAIRNFDEELAEEKTRKALEEGVDPQEAIEAATEVLRDIGDKFEHGELFLFDLTSAGDAMNASREILEQEILDAGGTRESEGKVILGTVEGDIHDIGKKILSSLLAANGYEVIDLGVEVPATEFVEEVKKRDADAVGASAMLTTTKEKQREIIEELEAEGIREEVTVMVGGAPVTEEWSSEIGADLYGANAFESVEKLGESRQAAIAG
ncbi:MAG: B12-binding domain-containing protein [Halodesulfurarchaeum sp.]